MLSRAGHKVVVASSAPGGLREYPSSKPFMRYDLVALIEEAAAP